MLLLGGCAASSGIQPLGNDPDSYVLTERLGAFGGGPAEATRAVMPKAEVFCRARDRRLLPLETEASGWGGVMLRFRCVTPRESQLNVGQP